MGIKGVPSADFEFRLTWGEEIYTLPITDDLTAVFDTLIECSSTNTSRFATLELVGTGNVDLYALQISRVHKLSTLTSANRNYPMFQMGTGMSGATLTEPTVADTLNALDTHYEVQMDV